jgi:hypothetical protein
MTRKEREENINDLVKKLNNRLSPISNDLNKILNEVLNSKSTSNTYWSSISVKMRGLYESARSIFNDFMLSNIPKEYKESLIATIVDLKQRSITAPNIQNIKDLKQFHSTKQSLKTILNDTLNSFYSGIKQGEVTFLRLINYTQQTLISETKINKEIADGYLEKGTSLNSKRRLKDALAKKLIDGEYITIIDKNGKERKYNLDTYSELVTRTKLMDASCQAVLDTAGEVGADLVQVDAHNTLCEVCAEYEGKIFSISGNDPNFPELDVDFPIHPNCQHNITVVFREALQADGTLEKYIAFSNDETETHPTRRGFIPISEREFK